MRKLRSYEEKGLSMQYHSINIEKLQKRIKNKFPNIAYQIRWSVRDEEEEEEEEDAFIWLG